MSAAVGPKTTEIGEAEMSEVKADLDFLLARALKADSCSFSNERWTGASSNALVELAYTGKHNGCLPSDRSDYAACVRTFRRLPKHRQTEAVRAKLKEGRDYYRSRYPLSS